MMLTSLLPPWATTDATTVTENRSGRVTPEQKQVVEENGARLYGSAVTGTLIALPVIIVLAAVFVRLAMLALVVIVAAILWTFAVSKLLRSQLNAFRSELHDGVCARVHAPARALQRRTTTTWSVRLGASPTQLAAEPAARAPYVVYYLPRSRFVINVEVNQRAAAT